MNDLGNAIDEEQPVPFEPAIVEIVSGPYDGHMLLIDHVPCVIGRDADDLALALDRDRWVSRRHAELRWHDNQWWICDLKSANGIQIGTDTPVRDQEVKLPYETVVCIGHTDLLLHQQQRGDAPVLPFI